MSFRMLLHVEITCDEPSCPTTDDERDVTVAQLRTMLTGLGWTHANGKDYCPEHRTAEPIAAGTTEGATTA
jgi:hypothetical protein